MTEKQAKRLGDYLRKHREQLGLSTRAVAPQVGVDMAQIIRLEQGNVGSPKPQVLRAYADALHLPVADVLTLAGYPIIEELPSFQPYLRTKYHDLPDKALNELEQSFSDITKRYKASGPVDGEDER